MKISIFPLIVKKIKQCLAINQDGATADRNIASGKYVCWKGDMYTANSAINSGDTLATGSGGNLTAVSDGVANALDSKIATLNSKFTMQEEALTSAYATSPETAFVKRTGNVVYWQFTAALTTALPMNTVFITIPQGFRPSNGKTRFTCYNSSDKKAILVSMGSNGDTQLIDYGSTLASSTVLQLSGTFIV